MTLIHQLSPPAALLRYLGIACKHRGIYPPNHPLVRRAMEKLIETAALLLRDRDVALFQIHEDTVFLDNQVLPEESLRNAALLTACLERGVGIFSIRQGITPAEVDAFVSLLIQPVAALRTAGGAQQYLAERQVQHLTVDAPRTGRVSELPLKVDPDHAYDAGHTAIQELRAQAIRKQPLDLNKARVFLSAAIDVVRENRFPLLALMADRDYDEQSSHHAVNVSVLALLIGTRLGLDRDQLMALGMGALLHDIGKVRLPQDLLNQVELTAEEQALLNQHAIHGANILRDLGGFGRVAAFCALEHHAHYDLSGFPTLRTKAHPHLFSRIVAVVDVYDTMTAARLGTDRALRPDLAMKWIAAGSGTVFDPVVGKIFIRFLGLYPVGSLVQLGSGTLAVVVRPSEQHIDRPLVRVISEGTRLGELIDLASETSQSIATGVDPQDVNVDLEALLREQPAAT